MSGSREVNRPYNGVKTADAAGYITFNDLQRIGVLKELQILLTYTYTGATGVPSAFVLDNAVSEIKHNIGIPNAGHNVNGMAYMSAMKYLDSSYTQRTTLAANSVVQIAVDLDYYIHQLANPLERLASALPLADLGENELSIKVPTVATDVFTAAAGGVYSVTGEVQLKTLPDVGKADPNLIPFVRTRRVDVNATGLLSGVNISGNAHVRMVHLLARKAGVRSDAVISRVNFNSVAGYERVSDFWKLQMENERENLNLGSLVGTGECFLDFGPEPEQFLNTYGSELVPLSLEAGDTGEVFVTEFGFLRR